MIAPVMCMSLSRLHVWVLWAYLTYASFCHPLAFSPMPPVAVTISLCHSGTACVTLSLPYHVTLHHSVTVSTCHFLLCHHVTIHVVLSLCQCVILSLTVVA